MSVVYRYFFNGVVNTALYVSTKTFSENKIHRIKSFFVFGYFEPNFFRWTFSGGAVKSGPYVSIGKKWRKNWLFLKTKISIIFGHGAKTSRFFSKIFKRGCQNCFIHVKKIFRTKVFAWKIVIFSIILGRRSNCSRISGNFFRAGFSKLHATCLQ